MSNRLFVPVGLLMIVLAGCGGSDHSQVASSPAPSLPDGAAPPPPPPPPPAPAAPAADAPPSEVVGHEPAVAVPPDEPGMDTPPGKRDAEGPAPAEPGPDHRAMEGLEGEMDRPRVPDVPIEDTTLLGRARQALVEGRFPDGIALLQAAALAEEEAANEVLNTLRWSPVLKRPMLAARWGGAVLVPGMPVQAPARQEAGGEGGGRAGGSAGGPMKLWHDAVGLPLFQALERRIAEGAFGRWLSAELVAPARGATPPAGQPPHVPHRQFDELAEGPPEMAAGAHGNPALRGILMTQVATLSDAKRWAADQQIDVLMTVALALRPGSLRGNVQTSLSMKAYDVAKNQEIWSSRDLSSRRVEAAIAGDRADEDPARDFVDDVLKYVDESLQLADMPKLDPTVVARRAAALAAEEHADPLPALVELRYYLAKGLLDASALRAHYTAILGPQDGAELSAGNLEQRRQVVEGLLP